MRRSFAPAGRAMRPAALALGLAASLALPAPADPGAPPAAPAPAGFEEAEGERPAAAHAEAVVERVHQALIGAIPASGPDGFAGRQERLGPVLRASFDFPFMAEKSVGRYWRDLAPEQRERLVDAFARLAVATYAARFADAAGVGFEVLGHEPATHDTVLVHARVARAGGEVVPLDYRLRPVGGDWRIVDVFLNGTVSELALRRSEYTSVLRREGFDGLLTTLEAKILAQANGGATEPS